MDIDARTKRATHARGLQRVETIEEKLFLIRAAGDGALDERPRAVLGGEEVETQSEVNVSERLATHAIVGSHTRTAQSDQQRRRTIESVSNRDAEASTRRRVRGG